MNSTCNSKGFTLVEIMATVAILGIIAAIGTTMLLRTLPNMRLKSATRDIFSAMMLAKSEAIKRGSYVAVLLDPSVTPNTYRVFLDDGSGVGGDAGNGVKDGTEIDLLAPTGLPANIGFGPVDLNSDGDFTDDGETGAADGITFPSYPATAATHTLVFSPKGIPGDDSNTLMSGTVGLRAFDSAGNVVRSRSVTTSTAGRVKLN